MKILHTPRWQKKNALNGLSNEYAKYMQEDSEKYFHRIDEFLRNPRNTKYRKAYNATTSDFRGVIISRRNEFDTFDEIIEEIFTECFNAKNFQGDEKRLLKVFVHFMYCSCDIGKRAE